MALDSSLDAGFLRLLRCLFRVRRSAWRAAIRVIMVLLMSPQQSSRNALGSPRSSALSRVSRLARAGLGIAAVGILAASCLFTTAAPASSTDGQGDEAQPETLADALVAAADAGAVTAGELAREAAVPEEGPGSLILDSRGRLSATVFWSGDGETMLSQLRQAVGSDGGVEARQIVPAATVWLTDPSQLDLLRAIPGVIGVTPNLRPLSSTASLADRLDAVRSALPGALAARATGPALQAPTPAGASCGPMPIEADAPQHADAARAEYGVDGTGVTIGIVSDSFAHTSSPTSWADDVASGALPGPGNPCGRTTPVTIVSDAAGGIDEGRAMAQLVHGIAPGATLLFADAGMSDLDMATGIALLVEAGADIIVDDISFFQEPYFQQGYISAVYEQARAEHGVLALSSAGNSTATATQGPHAGAPLSSWQTGAYRSMTCPSWVNTDPQDPLFGRTDFDCLDFDPGAGEQAYDLLTMGGASGEPERVFTVVASIGEPMYGVTTRYQVRFYEEQDPQDPELLSLVRMVGDPYPGAIGGVEVSPGTTVRMVFIREAFDAQASPAPAVFIGFPRGGDAIAERQFMGGSATDPATGLVQTDRVGSITLGHNGDGSTLSVAALQWDDPTEVRPYSSLGPSTLLFERVALCCDPAASPSPRLPEPRIVPGPSLAAVDGTRTTFFGEAGGAPGAEEYRFFGTSAAAPNAAAVAALGLSYAPGVSADQLRTALLDTARGTAAGGPVNPYDPALFADAQVFGAGIVDARALLAALPRSSPPGPGPGPGPGGGGSGGSGGGAGAGGTGSKRVSDVALAATGSPERSSEILVLAALLIGTGAGTGVVLAIAARRRPL